MIFLMMVNIQLPWLNKNDQCINFCFPFKTQRRLLEKRLLCPNYTFIHTTSPLHKEVNRGKMEQNSSICLQNSSPSLYNYILFILNQFPGSILEFSHQVNPNLVTWSILKHRNKTPSYLEKHQPEIYYYFFYIYDSLFFLASIGNL